MKIRFVATLAGEQRPGKPRWASSAAVSSSGEEITADAFVLAAGVESRALGRELGALIPLIGGKGYSITYGGSAPALSHHLYLAEARVAISPYRDGVRDLGHHGTGYPLGGD